MLTLRNRTKTVTALRSGKFKQARNVIYDSLESSYCCIGVAGKVLGLEVDEGSVTDSVGLDVGFSILQIDELVMMNDTRGYSFAAIADVIETFPVAA